MVGQTISHYKILAKLGSGGMGEVWKAEDTQLRRTVALKFLLPQAVGGDEVKARLIREAQVAASLDHPNICAVHGIHEEEGQTFIAMAYVEGLSLADRIKQRPLPLTEALDTAIQVGEGLREAHGKGVVHRDIKPQNILLTPKGQVKIMDFGLASLAGSSRLTKSGTTLGTPTYMAPEQIEAQEVDRRTDIWALGCVLYEMLAQRTPFEAEHGQAVAYRILNEEPEPVSAQRADVKPEVDQLIAKTLAKSPDERYQNIDDVLVDLRLIRKKVVLDERCSSTSPAGNSLSPFPGALTKPAAPTSVRTYQVLLLAAVAALVALTVLQFRRETPAAPLRKLGLTPGVAVADDPYSANVAISPNGKHVAFAVTGDGSGLWIQDFDQEAPRRIDGTTGALGPFWAPGSDFIGFAVNDELRKVPLRGGSSGLICSMRNGLYGGGTWSPDGETIVFAAGTPSTLFEVSAGGGAPRQILTQQDVAEQLNEPILYLGRPLFVPAGESMSLVLTAGRGDVDGNSLVLADLGSGQFQKLGPGDFAAYSSTTGHIVYQPTFGTHDIWALALDPQTLQVTGEPFLVAEDGQGPSVAGDGTLAYATARRSSLQSLVWADRRGENRTHIGFEQEGIAAPSLSPDDRRVAVSVYGRADSDSWIYDIQRGTRTRLTETRTHATGLVWSPSGLRVAFSSGRAGAGDIVLQRYDANSDQEAEILDQAPNIGVVTDWSADGQYLFFYRAGTETGWDVLYLERVGDGWERRVLFNTPFDEQMAVISPDGRLLAYVSDESGRDEIYVLRFPEATGKTMVSTNGGTKPRWSPDGKELFYVEAATLMAASLSANPAIEVLSIAPLFQDSAFAREFRTIPYDVSADGRRFIMVESVNPEGAPARIRIVQNWYEEFREREQD